MGARRTLVTTGLAAMLAAAAVTAAIAADPAADPPPRIAFLANGIVPADALAAGPVAGQLGAPVYTTPPDALPATTSQALQRYDPELVIVLGGPVAIRDHVLDQVTAATGLAIVPPQPPPSSGIVRAAGEDRFVTATVVADLLGAYDPAFLGVDLRAVDSDLLDGRDSGEFLTDADAAGFEAAGSAPLLFTDEVSTEVSFTDTVPHTVQALDATVPTAGRLLVTVSMEVVNELYPGRLAAVGQVILAGPSAGASPTFLESLSDDSTSPFEGTLSYTVSFPVTAGTHTVNSTVDAGTTPANYTVHARTLVVQFYPDSQVP